MTYLENLLLSQTPHGFPVLRCTSLLAGRWNAIWIVGLSDLDMFVFQHLVRIG